MYFLSLLAVHELHGRSLYLLSFPDYLSACPLSNSSFEKLTYFGILPENLGEMLEILRTFLRYFEIILWNCSEYFHEIF